MNNGNLVTFIFFILLAIPTGLADMTKPDKKILEIYLKKIAGERHPGPSAEHLAEVSRYVEDTFRNLGYEIEKHSFEAPFGIFENMIARKRGRHFNARIIVAAHLDTVSGTPGADDNAS